MLLQIMWIALIGSPLLTAAIALVLHKLLFVSSSNKKSINHDVLNSLPKTRKRRMSIYTHQFASQEVFLPQTAQFLDNLICCLAHFENNELPEREQLIQRMEQVLTNPKLKNFRSIAVKDNKTGEFQWQDMGDQFDWKEKLFFETQVSSEQQVMDYVQNCLVSPMTRDRPLWDVHFIRSSDHSKAASALLFRIHHAIGDGTSLVKFLMELVDSHDSHSAKLEELYAKRIEESMQKAKSSSRGGILQGLGFLVWNFVQFLKFTRRDSYSCVIGNCNPYIFSGGRACLRSPEKLLKLEKLKLVQKALLDEHKVRVTVNDILVSLITGALRRYLEFVDDPVLKEKNLLIRACLPIGFPPAKRENDDSELHSVLTKS
eukprot:TRINITY_DN38974_c0_g1_i1.p1 TRINITY_DN38974_c0_g1~~TRINITY_DN38974_c0_g1_i1.p1  ORF type:complete len:373 (-),score=107.55 TRINITY_DN38974_c0_g1_i1:782-1900(-)